MTRFQFRGCPRCGGDLFINQGDWQCLQCGRYPRPATATQRPPGLEAADGRPSNAAAGADASADAGGFWDFWRRRAV